MITPVTQREQRIVPVFGEINGRNLIERAFGLERMSAELYPVMSDAWNVLKTNNYGLVVQIPFNEIGKEYMQGLAERNVDCERMPLTTDFLRQMRALPNHRNTLVVLAHLDEDKGENDGGNEEFKTLVEAAQPNVVTYSLFDGYISLVQLVSERLASLR